MLRIGRALALSLLAVAGCAADGDPGDKDAGHWTPGKGDGAYDLIDAGPAVVGGRVEVTLDHRVPAYRVESFGGTKLTIDLAGHGSDPYLIVEGPLAGNGDKVAVGGGKLAAEDDDSGPGRDSHIELSLDQPGVYRILTGTYESLGQGRAATGKVSLSVACTANCFRPMIDQKAFVHALQAQGGPAFREYAKAEIASVVHDAVVAEQMAAQLDTILADPNLTGLDRFPTIPLSAIAALRPALGGIPSDPPREDLVMTGDLPQLLGACTPDRSPPAETDPRLPGVRYGGFPSTTLSPCQFAHAGKLAQILTALAAQNGSAITFKGKTITSPRELFAALVASGHTIEVRNERMYANFLSMIVGDRDLIWPVWIDTGIRLSNGETLTVPVGHSHHAWRISGPIVNTRVTFFLGISGAGFFGQTDSRPAWSGTIAATDVTVAGAQSADYDYLLRTADAASAYLRRNRIERTTVAAGMPADGYGYVGVCNDSNATLELATRGTTSAFPLLRARELDSEADLGDGLDGVIRTLPKDADALDQRDGLRRAVAMQPFADGSPLMFDTRLGAQIALARKDLGK
ncbi:MAG: hypothetical protein JWO36_3808 [Myxococcales bacterium]|nr:hypothetical protein [Myxococcales bacterium]